MKSKVFFRADGNSTIGLGHIFRSLALADMLRDTFDCCFLVRSPDNLVRDSILAFSKLTELSEKTSLEEEALLIANQYLNAKTILVLDGYHFDLNYQKILKKSDCVLVCIDDIHTMEFVADVIINHAGGLSPQNYTALPSTIFCLGLQYALLRSSFRIATQNRTFAVKANEKNNVFVCLGGADPNNNILTLLTWFEQQYAAQHFNMHIVIGGSYMHWETFNSFLKSTKLKTWIYKNLNSDQLVDIMQQCPQAICSSSTIAYEYISVGGNLFLYQTADNQQSIYNYFIESNLAYNWDSFAKLSSDKITKMHHQQEFLLDGLSQNRFIKLFQSLIK